MTPEYLHAVSNHILVVGLGIALFALLLSLLMGSRPAQVVGLAAVLLTSGAAYPVLRFGQEGYRNVRKIADDAGQDWLDTHMERAESWVVLYYGLSALALTALVLPKYKPGAALPLAIATLALGSVSIGAGAWIASAGGQVRHPEFRSSPELEDEAPDLSDDPPLHEH